MKRLLLTLLILASLASPALATNYRYTLAARTFTDGGTPVWGFWLCDTQAAMPTGAGVNEGDIGYAIDTNKVRYYDGAAWQDVASSGSGLTHPQVMTRVSLGGGY